MMRQKIVLRRRAVPKQVTLPNGTSFMAMYERMSRKKLPGNIRVTKTRIIGSQKKRFRKNRVRFALANTPTQDRARRIQRKCRRQQPSHTERGLVGDLAKLGIRMGSKAINSAFGKKIIDEGIKQVPNLYKYGTYKIKNKNVRKVFDFSLANYTVTEAQNKAKNNITNLFGGI